jgi:trehalose-6-phosphate synthase
LLVSQINGEFTESGCADSLHAPQSHRKQLLTHYRAADYRSSPLKDGMNLVAKELCCPGGRMQ